MARIDKPHSKPEQSKVGKLVDVLTRVQIYIARGAYQTAFEVAERGIQLATNRH
jgi:hypothetical protein